MLPQAQDVSLLPDPTGKRNHQNVTVCESQDSALSFDTFLLPGP